MAKYRVKDNPKTTLPVNQIVVASAGKEFDWDGKELDGDGDVRVFSVIDGLDTTRWVSPDSVEPVPESIIKKSARTVEEEIFILTLTRAQAECLFCALHNEETDVDQLDQIYDALTEALHG